MRILILDEQAIVRTGLRCVLEPDWCHPGGETAVPADVVAEASCLAEAEDLALEADVVLTDLVLPDAWGVEIVRALHKIQPGAAVFVFTTCSDPDAVADALQAGAKGYMLKDAAPAEVVDAVRRVAAGEVYVQPSLGAALLGAPSRSPAGHRVAPKDLTPREQDVLRHVALGHTNAEISAILCMSVRTVETHRSRLVRKLGLQTRAELVRYAVKTGLLHFDTGDGYPATPPWDPAAGEVRQSPDGRRRPVP